MQRSIQRSVLRVATVICIIVSASFLVASASTHIKTSQQPYYAQLTAKAVTEEGKKAKVGDQDGYNFVRDHSK